MQRAWAVMFVTTTTAVAAAQPSTVDPVEDVPLPSYPRALAERPLLLPRGFEIDTDFVFYNNKAILYGGDARIATDALELQFGLTYQLTDKPQTDADLATLYIAGLRQLAPCRQLAVGAQVVGRTLFGELPGFAPSALVQYKHTFAPWFGLQAAGSFGYEYSRAVEDMSESSLHGLAGTLGVRGQLQLSPVIAFEGRVSTAYRQDLGDYAKFGMTSFGTQTLGGMVLISASSTVDVSLSYDATLRSGSRAFETIVLGLVIRRL